MDIAKLQGKILAIDAPNVIFSLLNFSFKEKNPSNQLFCDRTQRAISHLYGLLYRVDFYYSKKIYPIFCFDGRDSDLKRIITKNKLNDFRYAKKMYEQAISNNNLVRAREIALGKEFMWSNVIEESKKLLGALGVPYLSSPASAEAQCAYLVKENIAHYSNSQDFDSLLFGCPLLVQNFSKSLKRKVQNKWVYTKVSPVLTPLEETLASLGIDIFQLVDLGILIGTDYFPGITNIGPKRALELIKRYKDIGSIARNEKANYDFSKLTPNILDEVRKIFLFPEVNENIDNVVWNAPDRSKIFELLCNDHTLDKERILNNFEKVSKYYNALSGTSKKRNRRSKVQVSLDFKY